MFRIDPEIIREMPLDNNKLSGHWGHERGRGSMDGRDSRNRLLRMYIVQLKTNVTQHKNKKCVHTFFKQ